MAMKVQASLLFVVFTLTGALSPANSATNAANERDAGWSVTTSGDAGSGGPFGGRAIPADWNPAPSATVASLSSGDLYRQASQAASQTSHPGGLSARLAARAANVESIAKVELGTTQWLALTVVVGLLGAARRRPAR